MCQTRILLHPGGLQEQKNGGRLQQKIIITWVDLYGLVLITGESLLHSAGPISIRISELWICVAFPRIFITTTSRGGRIKTSSMFPRTGTGRDRKESPLMYG